jgi:hypothetical protein
MQCSEKQSKERKKVKRQRAVIWLDEHPLPCFRMQAAEVDVATALSVLRVPHAPESAGEDETLVYAYM